MNISLIILVFAFLESSMGKNLEHPDPANHGWTGISDIAIRDLNDRAGYEKWKAEDMDDREKCFAASREHINNYLVKHPEWSLTDILLFWRCGVGGMRRPTMKQLQYMENGVKRYEMLVSGDEGWSR